MPDIEVAQYNIGPKDRQGSIRDIHRLLVRPHLVALSLNEARWTRGLDIEGPDWDRSEGWPASVVWYTNDEERFDVSEVGRYRLTKSEPIEPKAAGPTDADEKWINYVAGRIGSTNVVIGSMHLVPSIQFPKADALSEKQVARVCRWIDRWHDRGYVVVLLGDVNFTPAADNGAPLLKRLRLANAKAGPTHGNRLIDWVLVSPGVVRVRKAEVLPGHVPDDHDIVVVRLAVP